MVLMFPSVLFRVRIRTQVTAPNPSYLLGLKIREEMFPRLFPRSFRRSLAGRLWTMQSIIATVEELQESMVTENDVMTLMISQ